MSLSSDAALMKSVERTLPSTQSRLAREIGRLIPRWYAFQELRFTRNELWTRLHALRRRANLPDRRAAPPRYPVFAFVTDRRGVTRLVQRPLLEGGAGERDRQSGALVCSLQHLNGAACLAVKGELDLAGVASFLGYLTKASDGGANVVLDLSGLDYIDSSGINALLDAQRRFSTTGHQIVLAAVSPRIQRILQIVALEQVIPVYPTLDAAMKRLRDGGPGAA